MLSVNKIVVSPHYTHRGSEREYEHLREDILNIGIKIPLLVEKDATLLNGYKRLRAAKELGLNKVPVFVYPFSIKNKELKIVFGKRLSLLEEPLEQTKRIKYICLYFPEIFLTGKEPINARLTEHYENVSRQIGLSIRQLQRMKKIYFLAKAVSEKKSKDKIREGDLAETIKKINKRRVTRSKDVSGRSLFVELNHVYDSLNTKKKKEVHKKVRKILSQYKK